MQPNDPNQPAAAPPCSKKNTLTGVLAGLILLAVILAVYFPVGQHGFTQYDDNNYVVLNPHVNSGLSLENVAWAFFSTHASNWHPVTWLSHMLDVQLFGLEPGGHHLVNVALHAAASLLLLGLLWRLTGALWRSAFVAALFALHPLHVESVAWIAERKDVLSASFCFLTLLLYAQYTRERSPRFYWLAFLSFLLGLMSKPMLVSLPLLMLLIDFWPLERVACRDANLRQLLQDLADKAREKAPFFAAALVSMLITLYAQQRGGAIRSLDETPLGLRIENALVATVSYVGKTLWPKDLAFYYPMPETIPLWQVAGALVLLLLVTMAVLRAGSRYRYLVVGWLWFLISLLPVIGLVQVGRQAMADRYSYLPLVGLFIAFTWGACDLARRGPLRLPLLGGAAGGLLLAASWLTWQQVGYWRTDVLLFQHNIEATAPNYLPHYELGIAFAKAGDLGAAAQQFQETINLKGDCVEAYNSLGLALAQLGNLDAALANFQETLRLQPTHFEAHNNLGVALMQKGEASAALTHFQESLRLKPDFGNARDNLQAALAQTGAAPGAR